MRMTKIYFKRSKMPLVYAFGIITCFFLTSIVDHFSAQDVQAIPVPDSQINDVKSSSNLDRDQDRDADLNGADIETTENRQENDENHLIIKQKVSHFIRYSKYKKPETFLLYHGVYRLSDFPYPVSIDRGIFYAEVPQVDIDTTDKM